MAEQWNCITEARPLRHKYTDSLLEENPTMH